jgi:hypothetical protein
LKRKALRRSLGLERGELLFRNLNTQDHSGLS